MGLIAEIAAWSILASGALLFLVQALVLEIGYWLGRRHMHRRTGDYEGVGAVLGAILALLAFVLALILSLASTRFDERRAATLTEANAIGTAWLRAEAITTPQSTEIAHLLEEYARVRADIVKAPNNQAEIEDLTRRTAVLQTEIWNRLSVLAAEQPNPITASLMAALNEAFDASAAQRFADAYTYPPQLFWSLVGLALLATAALGFQLGVKNNPLRVLTVALIAMWAVVIVDIWDLGTAHLGTIRTTTVAYDWLIQGFGGKPVKGPSR
jgi:hypothetical protein